MAERLEDIAERQWLAELLEDAEDGQEPGNRQCPRGFDGFGFGNFVRRRDNRPVEAYAWGDGTISWMTIDRPAPMRSGICLERSFFSHHAPPPHQEP